MGLGELERSDMSFATAVKIILRYYITPELILQLIDFKNYLEKINFYMFVEVFGQPHRKDKFN